MFTIKSLMIFLRTFAQESAVDTTDFRFLRAFGDVLKSDICL